MSRLVPERGKVSHLSHLAQPPNFDFTEIVSRLGDKGIFILYRQARKFTLWI